MILEGRQCKRALDALGVEIHDRYRCCDACHGSRPGNNEVHIHINDIEYLVCCHARNACDDWAYEHPRLARKKAAENSYETIPRHCMFTKEQHGND